MIIAALAIMIEDIPLHRLPKHMKVIEAVNEIIKDSGQAISANMTGDDVTAILKQLDSATKKQLVNLKVYSDEEREIILDAITEIKEFHENMELGRDKSKQKIVFIIALISVISSAFISFMYTQSSKVHDLYIESRFIQGTLEIISEVMKSINTP